MSIKTTAALHKIAANWLSNTISSIGNFVKSFDDGNTYIDNVKGFVANPENPLNIWKDIKQAKRDTETSDFHIREAAFWNEERRKTGSPISNYRARLRREEIARAKAEEEARKQQESRARVERRLNAVREVNKGLATFSRRLTGIREWVEKEEQKRLAEAQQNIDKTKNEYSY